jgi:hypothetical protein
LKITRFQTDEVKKRTRIDVNFGNDYGHMGHEPKRVGSNGFEFKVGAPMQNDTFFLVKGKYSSRKKRWTIEVKGELICDPTYKDGKCGRGSRDLPRTDFELRRRDKPVELKYPIIEGRVWDCLCF